jgi:type II secretory pathway predicted ATPase ExeA
MTKTKIQQKEPDQKQEQGKERELRQEQEPMPFSKSLSYDVLFTYSQLNELHRLLRLTIDQKSMLLCTGQAGVGKTTAIRAVTDELPTNKYLIAYLGQDQEAASVWRRLSASFGLRPRVSRAHTRLSVSQYLNDNLIEQGKDVILVVDEAHLLDATTLEDIRLLTNTDFDRASALTIILLGQLSLRSRVKTAGFEALNQRLRYRYALEGFTEDETTAYIKHHLHLANKPQDLFSPEAIKLIFFASQGIPREINNYCLTSILKAQSTDTTTINGKLVRQVLDQRDMS